MATTAELQINTTRLDSTSLAPTRLESASLEPVATLAQRAVDLAWSRDARVAVAESCTAGAVATALATTDGAGACFQGGVVAFSASARHSMLNVSPASGIGHDAARQMARGALERFDADVAIATIGVLGPVPEDGQPVGTLWLGGCSRQQPALAMRKVLLADEPVDRRVSAVQEALGLLIMLLEQ